MACYDTSNKVKISTVNSMNFQSTTSGVMRADGVTCSHSVLWRRETTGIQPSPSSVIWATKVQHRCHFCRRKLRRRTLMPSSMSVSCIAIAIVNNCCYYC